VVIEDLRELIFPIFTVPTLSDNEIHFESRKFLGTGFFVSKEGDALTAAHVIPTPDRLEEDHRLIAVLMHDGEQKVCWINKALIFSENDAALIQVNFKPKKILTIAAENVSAGEDVVTIGFTSHSVNNHGLEARVLKGHVTLAHKNLELNFAIPAGMSGAPVIINNKILAISIGRVRSEELIDYYEEEVKLTNSKEIIKITEIKNVIHYGIALSLSRFCEKSEPQLNNLTVMEYITKANNS
jgi:hypothetical protein